MRATQPGVITLGYVEKVGGEKESIVEVDGQVSLVNQAEANEISRRAQSPAGHAQFLPATGQSVGFVEKANGEKEIIVADQGGVHLVPADVESSDNLTTPQPLPAEAKSINPLLQHLKFANPSAQPPDRGRQGLARVNTDLVRKGDVHETSGVKPDGRNDW
jgi:hypothetical protein